VKALRDLVIVTDRVIDPVGLRDRVNGKLVGIGLRDIVLEVVSEGGLLA
jgi:hypothetical protein